MNSPGPGDRPEDRAALEIVRGLVDYAAARGLAVGPWEVLDAAWLASFLPDGGKFRSPAEPAPERPPPRHEPPSGPAMTPEEPPPEPGPGPLPGPNPIVPIHPDVGQGAGGGTPLNVPAPPVFPDKRAFLRAWRPLMLRGPAPGRTQLDVDATARRWSEERLLDVVERPTRERLVDLILVLDFGPSMDMWRGPMRELAEMFRSCGGFRRVTVACLVGDERGHRLVAPRDVGEAAGRSPRLSPRGTAGSSLHLIVSDCISAHWRDAGWLGVLDDWARRGAVALLQVLPEHLWPRTALELAETRRVLPVGPLTPNRGYRVAESAADILELALAEEEAGGRPAAAGPAPLPCASLFHEAGLGRVVRLLSGRPDFPVVCYQLRAHPGATTARDLDPSKALEIFGLRATRPARDLATLLAASPAVSLPLARIVRQGFLHVAGGPSLEAEIWTSGLLEPIEDCAGDDPEQVLYRFRDGIQRRLLDGVPRSLRRRVIEATSRYIEAHLGRLRGFTAMLARPDENRGRLEVGPGSDPLALVAAEILRRQGGTLAQIVDDLAREPAAVADLSRAALASVFRAEQACHRFAWSPDGTTLAIPTRNGTLALLDLAAGREIGAQVSRLGLNQVAWSPDGRRIAVACYARVVRIFDTELRRLLQINGHNSDVTAVAFAPSGAYLATGTAGGTVRVWEARDGRLVGQQPAGSAGAVRALLWLDAEHLVAGYATRTRILRVGPSGPEIARDLPAGATAMAALATTGSGWLPASTILVLGQPNGELQFWDARSWELARSVFPHRGSVSSVDVSADGRLVASKARDGTVALLRADTGGLMARLATQATTSPYGCVALRPGSHTLAVAQDDDREILLYHLPSLTAGLPRVALRVRIVGSDAGRPGFDEACRQIGRELNGRGHALVICSVKPTTADYQVFLGYLEGERGGGRVTYILRGDSADSRRELEALRDLIRSRGDDRRAILDQAAAALAAAFPATILRDLISPWRTPDRAPEVAHPRQFLRQVLAAAEGEGWLPELLKSAAERLPANRVLSWLSDRASGLDAAVEVAPEAVDWDGRRDGVFQAQVYRHADAALVIGGKGGTELACRVAEGFGIPLLPLGAFGGTAAKAWAPGTAGHPRPDGGTPQWWRRLGGVAEVRALGPPGDPAVSSWRPESAARAVDVLEAGASRTPERGRDPAVLHIEVETHDGTVAIVPGILVDPRTILTAAHGLHRAARAFVIPPGRQERVACSQFRIPDRWIKGDEAWDCALMRMDEPATDPAAVAEPAAYHRSTLYDAVVFAGIGPGTDSRWQRGIVAATSRRPAISIWTEEAPRSNISGSPVVLRLDGRTALVGLVTRSIGRPERPRLDAMLVTPEMLDWIGGAAPWPSPGAGPDEPTGPPPPGVVVSRWVCVVGTGQYTLTGPEHDAARAVGRILADLSFGLVTGGWPGVDHVTAKSFWDRSAEHQVEDPDARLVHVVRQGHRPDFSHGLVRAVESEDRTYLASVEACDAVVVIGGLGGAKAVAEVAIERGVPVIPLLGTGGDADVLHARVLHPWHDLMALPVDASSFDRATRWPLGDESAFRHLLQRIRTSDHPTARAEPTSAVSPSHRVLVVGHGEDRLPAVVDEASRHLGVTLAEAGLGLITGAFPGVDYLVSEAMQGAVRERGLDAQRWITQYRAPAVPPQFQRGRIAESKDRASSMGGAIGDADAVVLIAGKTSAREMAAQALDAGKPVLPLSATGGTAEQVFRSTFAAWDRGPAGTLGIHEYLLLSLPVPTSVDEAIKLIDRLLGRPAPSRSKPSPTMLTARHLAIAASCWRAPKFDAKFKRPMYRFDVVLVCPDAWLGRVESVEYFLDGTWPSTSTPKMITTRADRFKFKELTWGHSVTVRAEVCIRDQDEAVALQCTFERSETGPHF